MKRVAIVSVHGCPIARLGSKDTGGMNVYVRQVAQELSGRGIYVDIYTRDHEPDDQQIVVLGERARVIHVKAGDHSRQKEDLPACLPEFVHGLLGLHPTVCSLLRRHPLPLLAIGSSGGCPGTPLARSHTS